MAITSAADARVRVGLRDTLSLLRRNRPFARLSGAQLISFMGDWFTTVALLGLVSDLTGSAVLVSLVLVAHTIPFAILAPIGGHLADRFDRRRLMIVADVARAALAPLYLLVDSSGQVWLAFAVMASVGGIGALFAPAAQAAVPNLVDPEDLPAANVLVGSAWGAMLAVGGALGGLVAATLGRDAAFLGDSATFIVSAILLLGIRARFSEPREEEREAPGLTKSMGESLRFARGDHRVLALLAVKTGFGLSVGVLGLLPLFALEVWGAGDRGTGILFAARGLGAVVGPFLVRRFTDSLRGLFLAIGVSFAVYGIGYGVFPFAPGIALATIPVFFAHLGGGAQWTLSTYGLQRIVPDRHRGRVFAIDYGLVTLTIAGSLTLAGWAADHLPPTTVMLALAGVSLAWSVAWTALTARLRREGSLDPATSGPETPAEAAEATPPPAEETRPEARPPLA
ncbi:MAG TPA: MFS transporter, partial [Thermoanaerobaculia bacterium]|nr:MFS transporter [Thermoanaerobaculia bacterium]